MVSTLEVVAIVELCVYLPFAFLAAFVVFRHGFRKQLGWIFLVTFCIIRIAGAVYRILSEKNPGNATDIEWATILGSIGLSPLLMATMGLLKRITDQVSDTLAPREGDSMGYNTALGQTRIGGLITKRATAVSARSRTLQVAHLPTMIALILCIVGGMDSASSDPSEVSTGPTYTKVGVALFLVVYVLIFFLVVITMGDVRDKRLDRGEKRIYIAVVCALPLLAVRLLWTSLSAYTSLSDFGAVTGKVGIQIAMVLVEEVLIVFMYVVVGLFARR